MDIKNISNIQELQLNHKIQMHKNNNENSFSQVLEKELKESTTVKFSKHALIRMNERGVVFNESLKKDLAEAVEKAREKGAKDVVIIGKNNAFIVNVPNNTVITTMNAGEMRDNVFTNIDSAVLL